MSAGGVGLRLGLAWTPGDGNVLSGVLKRTRLPARVLQGVNVEGP